MTAPVQTKVFGENMLDIASWQAHAGWRGVRSERLMRRSVACVAWTLDTCITCLSFDEPLEMYFGNLPTSHRFLRHAGSIGHAGNGKWTSVLFLLMQWKA